MGDGGDGGGAEGMDALAAMPVEFGSETVIEVSGDPADDFDGAVFVGGGGGDGGSTARERGEGDLIELAWVEPDAHSGP
jgi:hypothetical protein